MVVGKAERDHTGDLMQIHDGLGRQSIRRILYDDDKTAIFSRCVNFYTRGVADSTAGAVNAVRCNMYQASADVHWAAFDWCSD